MLGGTEGEGIAGGLTRHSLTERSTAYENTQP